jgi:phosphonate metabolism-associated iron-containing alcohol dehydrogenase
MKEQKRSSVSSLQGKNPVDIIFCTDSIKRVEKELSTKRVLLVTTKGSLKRFFKNAYEHEGNRLMIIDDVKSNPTFQNIESQYDRINHNNYDLIIALGGGSVIDTAKVLSLFPKQRPENFSLAYLSNKDNFEELNYLPVMAIPTTAGTGSEVTPWATVWDFESKKKLSFENQKMWAKTCLCDYSLTTTMSKELTINTGLDALSHALESIWNKNSNDLSKTLAIKASKEIIHILPLLKADLTNNDLRKKMMNAANTAGRAFSKTKTATAHALSYQMTIDHGLAHGIACSYTIPTIIKAIMNSEQLKETQDLLIEIWGKRPYQSSVNFFSELGIALNYQKYGISKEEMIDNIHSAANNPRGQNGVVPTEKLKQAFEI